MATLRALWLVVFRPDHYFRSLELAGEGWRWAVLPFVLGTLGSYGSAVWISEALLPDTRSPLVHALATIPAAALWFLAGSLVLHGIARLVEGARGPAHDAVAAPAEGEDRHIFSDSFANLHKFLGFAQAPGLLLGFPMFLLGVKLVLGYAGSGVGVVIDRPVQGSLLALFIVGALAFGAWRLVLTYKAIRFAYGLNGQTWTVLLLWLLVLWVVVVPLAPRVAAAFPLTASAFEPMRPTFGQGAMLTKSIGLNTLRSNVMSPSLGGLRRGDIILVDSRTSSPGQTEGQGGTLVRVIGVAGEKVDIQAGGSILVNGVPLDEPYAATSGRDGLAALEGRELSVPEGAYFVLGDDRSLAPGAYGGGVVPRQVIVGRLPVLGVIFLRFLTGR